MTIGFAFSLRANFNAFWSWLSVWIEPIDHGDALEEGGNALLERVVSRMRGEGLHPGEEQREEELEVGVLQVLGETQEDLE